MASFFLRSIIGISSQQYDSFCHRFIAKYQEPVSKLFFEDRIFSFTFLRFLRSDCTPLTRTSKFFITHVSPILCFLMFVYSPVGFACYFVIIVVIEEKKGFFF